MSSRDPRLTSSDRSPRPAVVDEWGIYDPSQAGLEALFERLEEKQPATDELDAAAIAASMHGAKKLSAQ